MRRVFNDSELGEIIYEEGLFSGKKRICINKKEAHKVDKTTYSYHDGEKLVIIGLQGGLFSGVSMKYLNRKIQLVSRSKWYEYLFMIFPLIFVLIWGNSAKLTLLFPVIGGAIGGVISAFCGWISMYFIKKCDKWWLKIIVGLLCCFITISICHIIAIGVIQLLS